MKEIIEAKLTKIRLAQKEMETIHLYHLAPAWVKLRTQELILEEVLRESEMLKATTLQ